MDVTEKFNISIANFPFQSFDDFVEKLQLFQQESGFMFRKRDAIKLQPMSPDFQRLVYKRVYYVCIHYGSYKSTAVDPLKHRTIRCDCPAAFYLLMKDSALTVKKFKMIHNHPPEPTVVKRRRLVKRPRMADMQSAGRSCESTSSHLSTRLPDRLKELAPCSPSLNVIPVRRKRLGPVLERLESLLLVSSTRTYRDALGRLHELIDHIQASDRHSMRLGAARARWGKPYRYHIHPRTHARTRFDAAANVLRTLKVTSSLQPIGLALGSLTDGRVPPAHACPSLANVLALSSPLGLEHTSGQSSASKPTTYLVSPFGICKEQCGRSAHYGFSN
uniref:FAR1 domain-containing protein n=1 Tax=Echinococcus canadensis TaxID=519352 RepID=A0A915ESW9_9CEST